VVAVPDLIETENMILLLLFKITTNMVNYIVQSTSRVISRFFLNFIFFSVLVISQSGCFQHFYQTDTTTKVDTVMLNQLSVKKKYFIVHTPAEVFSLKNVIDSNGILSGDKDTLNPKYEKYLNPVVGESKRLKGNETEIVFTIVHIYTKENTENEHVGLAIDQIIKLEDYGVDKAADKNSKTLSIVGIVAVPVTLVALGFVVSNNLNF
jgi:hypothetical protein